ncbi:hypothetical protein RL0156 [Rhizobium johnstonii 3841]|uniref:Uncharacterized protein n=1 Tax=Rhizobium johnstonii (strain DSM 114642 / LMG 32736 / 3841) TaxID=216596 RepID=Q1MN07_RHIJ3|nr:hypothetical protein RL0156 [Rhizobium johnstonii 3841]
MESHGPTALKVHAFAISQGLSRTRYCVTKFPPFKLRSSPPEYKLLKDNENSGALTNASDRSMFCSRWHMPRKRSQALLEKRANEE